ncbi:unnamed protein product [Closterium sp. NIES-54]
MGFLYRSPLLSTPPIPQLRYPHSDHSVGQQCSQGGWCLSQLNHRSPLLPIPPHPLSFGILILTTMSGNNALKADEYGNNFNVRKWVS